MRFIMSFLDQTFTGVGRSSQLPGGEKMVVSVSGTFVATIDLERSSDSGSTWLTIESYTAPVEKNIESISDKFLYSLNVSAFTSGTVNVLLGK